MDMSKVLVYNGNGKPTHRLVWESGYPWLQEIVTGFKTLFMELFFAIQANPKLRIQDISLSSPLVKKV